MRGSVLMLPPRTRILVDRDNRDSWPDCAHVHNAKDRPSQDRPKRLLQMQEPDTELLAATHVNTQQPARLDDGPRTRQKL